MQKCCLISSTNELRFETLEEVKAFELDVRNGANALGGTLANFSWVEKEDKREEITYYQVKYKITWGTLREPDYELVDPGIEYHLSPIYRTED